LSGIRPGTVGPVQVDIATVVANAAIARELAGWCWSLAVLE
jgi:hypothetical protein